MRAHVRTEPPEESKADALAVGIVEGGKSVPERLRALDLALGGAIAKALALHPGAGKLKEWTLLAAKGARARRVFLVGLGPADKLDAERLRDVAGFAARRLRALGAASAALELIEGRFEDAALGARAVVEGALMGLYESEAFKTRGKSKRRLRTLAVLVERPALAEAREGARVGAAVGAAVSRCRDLCNAPANEMTPTLLADAARKMARDKGLRCEVLGAAEMERLGMGALLAVARGSAEPPRFIVLEHRPPGAEGDVVCVVGKGVTFDSGGISLKPADGMWRQKTDMSGGAAAIAVLGACADLRLPTRVVGVVPTVENMPGGRAQKPGDVVRTLAGPTVEIHSTDAEGRMILADALTYAARRWKPVAMIDLATLTGAVVTTLGRLASGLMGTDPALLARLRRAAEVSGDRVWELPLWEDYESDLKSDTADLKNIGSSGGAGTILGGIFLKRFAEGVPWAHLDIAGTAREAPRRGHLPAGPTGAGVRLLAQLLLDWEN